MKAHTIATAFAVLCTAGYVSAANPSPDTTFINDAAKDNMTEVKMGELAKEKGQREEVKSYGETLVRDHSKANDDLKKIADGKQLTLPQDITDEQKKHLSMLEKLNGAAFDRAFAEHMVADHQKAISKFKVEAKSGKDQDVKQFAGQTLPTLEEHLKLAKEISGNTGKGNKKQ